MSKVDIYMVEFVSYIVFFVLEILNLEEEFIKKEIERIDELK